MICVKFDPYWARVGTIAQTIILRRAEPWCVVYRDDDNDDDKNNYKKN